MGVLIVCICTVVQYVHNDDQVVNTPSMATKASSQCIGLQIEWWKTT